jgi:hypothetical protein
MSREVLKRSLVTADNPIVLPIENQDHHEKQCQNTGEVASRRNLSGLPLLTPEQMEDQIEMKEHAVSELKEQALDLQDRFVWDLAVAVKQLLVVKWLRDPGISEGISKVGVMDILTNLQEDPPYPEDWVEWIQDQYLLGITA